MTTITLPSDLERRIDEEAKRLGKTPQEIAVGALHVFFAPASSTESAATQGKLLFDFLDGYIGTVSGTVEPLSENSSQHFLNGLLEKQQRGNL